MRQTSRGYFLMLGGTSSSLFVILPRKNYPHSKPNARHSLSASSSHPILNFESKTLGSWVRGICEKGLIDRL